MIEELKAELQSLANPEQVQILQRFFKTGVGEYGEGDIFLGVKVPVQREVAKKYELGLDEIEELLDSQIHEHRMIGLFILIKKYNKCAVEEKKNIFDFYLRKANEGRVNNWDLIDLSAPNIVGDFLLDKFEERKILFGLAKSKNLWERRIAIISCFAFIRKNEFEDALKISEMLLGDEHDLIHKGVGWMLREIGKRDLEIEEKFLLGSGCYRKMPRVMLRYAIEKFEEGKRKGYLMGEIN